MVCFHDVTHVRKKRMGKKYVVRNCWFWLSIFFMSISHAGHILLPTIYSDIKSPNDQSRYCIHKIEYHCGVISSTKLMVSYSLNFEVQSKANTKWNANNYKIETKHAFRFISSIIISFSSNHRLWYGRLKNCELHCIFSLSRKRGKEQVDKGIERKRERENDFECHGIIVTIVFTSWFQ